MRKKRRRFSLAFKTKADLAAVRSDETLVELGAKIGVRCHDGRSDSSAVTEEAAS